ncbi:MAG: nitroreductase family deazaflavin-dependent oxidoreductase [Chloroflexota bacterium]|nr:nitroreductase family deazaflavin-dependent oxidoreductase [Chloroflexota bacterium]
MRISLTTTGRKTGQQRMVPLFAFEDADRLVIVGSRGGSAKDPAWAGNLRADSRATVSRGDEEWPVRAYEATGDERERLWRLVSAEFPLYESYRQRTTRTIPVFVLEPARAD